MAVPVSWTNKDSTVFKPDLSFANGLSPNFKFKDLLSCFDNAVAMRKIVRG